MSSVVAAETLAELEDIYLPYKPKRKTRASVTEEKGREPWPQKIFDRENFDLDEFAKSFIDAGKDVERPDRSFERRPRHHCRVDQRKTRNPQKRTRDILDRRRC